MGVLDAIKFAESVLPGRPAPDGETDVRWQAIIAIGEYIESNPEEVWQFAAKWGRIADRDLQNAVATCLLEHLLEHHFDLLFPHVQSLAKSDRDFANAFLGCWKFGQADAPGNRERFDGLMAECDRE
jgi:hypothetical protein